MQVLLLVIFTKAKKRIMFNMDVLCIYIYHSTHAFPNVHLNATMKMHKSYTIIETTVNHSLALHVYYMRSIKCINFVSTRA